MTDQTVLSPLTSLSNRKCSGCEHFLLLEESGGLCRRFPPVPMVVGMNQGPQQVLANKPRPIVPIIQPFFPRVGSEDVCGEYSMKMAGRA